MWQKERQHEKCDGYSWKTGLKSPNWVMNHKIQIYFLNLQAHLTRTATTQIYLRGHEQTLHRWNLPLSKKKLKTTWECFAFKGSRCIPHSCKLTRMIQCLQKSHEELDATYGKARKPWFCYNTSFHGIYDKFCWVLCCKTKLRGCTSLCGSSLSC